MLTRCRLDFHAAFSPSQVSERLRSTVRTNQQFVNAGANFMLLNGMLVEVKNFEIFSEYACAFAVVILAF